MQEWDLRRLQKFLEANRPATLYYLVGDEVYLLDSAIKLLRTKTLEGAEPEFNSDLFFAGDCNGSTVRDAVETLPVMCERRLVILRDAEKFNEKNWEQLLPVLENPVETTTLILVAEKVDRRKKAFKLCQQNGVVVDLKRPYENQVPLWIDYIAFQHGLKLERDAIAGIHQWVGVNLMEINNEVIKLKSYLGDRKTATLEDIRNVVSRSKAESIFDLTEAIGKQDRVQALSSLAQLLGQGQSEVGAVAMVQRHIRILAKIKGGLREGLSGAKLCAVAGVPQFYLKQYISQSQLWSEDKISNTLEALYQTDLALKSSPVSAHIWLENFVIHTCS